jgi:hypothetical protein
MNFEFGLCIGLVLGVFVGNTFITSRVVQGTNVAFYHHLLFGLLAASVATGLLIIIKIIQRIWS